LAEQTVYVWWQQQAIFLVQSSENYYRRLVREWNCFGGRIARCNCSYRSCNVL